MLTFDPEAHAYLLDGSPVRSVTGILRKVGLVNFDAVPSQILEAARTRGTVVHRAVHFYNEADLDVAEFVRVFPEYAGYLQSWIRLMDTGRLVTHFCEHRIASRAPRYSGTFDWLGLFDGRAALIDFATGSPADAAKHLQTAAYVMAAREWSAEPDEDALHAFLADRAHVTRFSVQLDRAGALPTPTPYSDPRDFGVFRLLADSVNAVDAERPRTAVWDWQREEEIGR